MQLDNNIIRAAFLPDDQNFIFVSRSSGRQPEMPRGAPLEFQFSCFKNFGDADNDPELYDISNFAGLPELRIRTTNAAGSVLLDDTVASSVEKDPTVDLTSWNDGSKQHFRFVFPYTTTAITAGTQFIVVFGPNGQVYGKSFILVVDPGTGAAASPTPSADGFYTKTEARGLLADKLDKQFAVDQPIVFYALNPTTGKNVRISLQPIFDEQGPRLVPIPEYLD